MYEPQHDKTNKMTYAPSEDSDQPGHASSLCAQWVVEDLECVSRRCLGQNSGHKCILVECSVIALCLPVMSKLSRYKLVCYK